MGAKATGAELQAFYEAWPPGDDWCHDDSIETHNPAGEWILDPLTKYDLDDLGTINWQGDRNDAPDERCINFGSWFKRWKKEQDTSLVVVTVPKADLDALLALCKEHGWKAKVS